MISSSSSEKSEAFTIAQGKTNLNWKDEIEILKSDTNSKRWKDIFENYFKARLELRYFQPIDAIQKNGLLSGEGFSIVAIQCSMIEFLQSTVEGKNFKYRKPDPKKYQYNDSSPMFKRFLEQQLPFSEFFKEEQTRNDFYTDVRCAVLHEARTIRWRIHGNDPLRKGRVIDAKNKIIYRNDFTTALRIFIESYGKDLEDNKDGYRAAFIRKYNALAELKDEP